MNESDVKYVLAVVESFKAPRESPEARALWRKLWGAKLLNHPRVAVMQVLDKLLETTTWRPSLAEILAPLLAPSGLPPASEAFAAILAAVGRRPRVVGDLEAEAVRRLGGWEVVGLWEIDARHFQAKQFSEVWADVCDRERREDMRAIASGGERLALAPVEPARPRMRSSEPDKPKPTGEPSKPRDIEAITGPLLARIGGGQSEPSR